jgi:g-D-glutamyl-meso-diaminopimelate peptidase
MPNGTEIQRALMKAGYYKGDVDGQIGSKTKDAIKKFQSANKLNPDGVIGSRTWQLLSKYLDTGS